MIVTGTLFSLLAFATSASAKCAWVLWQEVPVSSERWSLDTGREMTGRARPFLRCLPDIVDPRGPKGH
jgi:hypothetical protein